MVKFGFYWSQVRGPNPNPNILIIFEHSETELDNFLTHMNATNRAIKFTHEKSLTTVTFLDVTIYKEKDNPTLQYKTHIKPTNKQLYVKYDSHHPPGTFKGVITGEAIRFRRTNSKATDFHKIILKHKRKLQPHQQTLENNHIP